MTFDQPLWIKAVEVVTAGHLNVACRLCTFHTIVSFFISIGPVMSGSGLSQALECCYGTNAVRQMLTGKTVVLAVRGHFIVDSCLNVLLLHIVLEQVEDCLGDLDCLTG